MRCHVCGRTIDLTAVRDMHYEAQRRAAEDARVRIVRQRMAQAKKYGYAGLRLDETYRTLPEQPINLDTSFAEYMHLDCKFHTNLTAECSYRIFVAVQGEIQEEDHHSDTTNYEVMGLSQIRFAFDAGNWECDFDGTVSGEQLKLAFRMEEYFGLSDGPKCVVEGEAQLLFEAS